MTLVGNLTQNIIDKCVSEFHKNEDKIKQKLVEPFISLILGYVHQQLCPFLYIICTIFILTFIMTVIILIVLMNKKAVI
tara:strand:- start:622 stop:858 length:237 start_codon:yes stop_codon:yes gene_type:complete